MLKILLKEINKKENDEVKREIKKILKENTIKD